MRTAHLMLPLFVAVSALLLVQDAGQAYRVAPGTVDEYAPRDPLLYNPLNGERRPEDNPGFNERLSERQLEERRSGPPENPRIDERKRDEYLELERRSRGNSD